MPGEESKPNGKSKVNKGSDALGFESQLWDSANKLRGKIHAAKYMNVVMPILYLKFFDDQFKWAKKEIEKQGKDSSDREEYWKLGASWLPKESRMKSLVSAAKEGEENIGMLITDSLVSISTYNPHFEWLSSPEDLDDIPERVLHDLIICFGNPTLPSFGGKDGRSKDIMGRVFEYFVGRFAIDAKSGEFYTPRSVTRLLVEMLQPMAGNIYDGCCGSGGMFVQSLKFLDENRRVGEEVTFFGQESNKMTWEMAKMNLTVRNCEFDLGDKQEDTLVNDIHSNLEADFVMTNPPFNISDWGWEDLQDDERWVYGVPPKGCANYAWIQHYLYHLADQGMAGIMMANGSLSSTRKQEKEIREGIIDADKLDCVVMLPDRLFTNTAISACIWFLANDKTDPLFRNRSGETLFIDCRWMGTMVNRTKRELSSGDIDKISSTYLNWRSRDNFESYTDELGFCKAETTEGEITEHGYNIVPGRYVGAPPLPKPDKPYNEAMECLIGEMKVNFAEHRRIEKEISKNLRDLGFEY